MCELTSNLTWPTTTTISCGSKLVIVDRHVPYRKGSMSQTNDGCLLCCKIWVLVMVFDVVPEDVEGSETWLMYLHPRVPNCYPPFLPGGVASHYASLIISVHHIGLPCTRLCNWFDSILIDDSSPSRNTTGMCQPGTIIATTVGAHLHNNLIQEKDQ